MIGWIAAKLLSAGIGANLDAARRFAIGGLIAVAIVGLGIGGCWAKRTYDAGVVERARTDGNRKVGEATTAANSAAADARVEGARRAQAEHDELKGSIDAAKDPGAARRSFRECVRLQQRARAAGHPAPACR